MNIILFITILYWFSGFWFFLNLIFNREAKELGKTDIKELGYLMCLVIVLFLPIVNFIFMSFEYETETNLTKL